MKKLLVFILAIAYMATASGATVYMHYCMGKVVEWNMMGIEKSKCPKCGISKKKCKGCCKNKYQYFKVKDSHVSAVHVDLPDIHVDVISSLHPSFEQKFFVSEKSAIAYQSHAPPLHYGVPVYISHCVFRI